ncbi:benzoate/H(+) symporter BenE family transporter [Nocardioides sp. NPDC101246]|uniref:benzoate/H(+) symporter BenE family transporter n=1 Tax=Nocardioides sp. NPDC101246 TaxID=3364336 RepID=UPI0037F50802
MSTIVRDAPTGLRRDLGRHELVNGFVGFLFSATGPVAIILAVGHSAGLSAAVVASWVSAVFVLNSVLTIAAALWTRQPLVFFYTIPGTVVVGQAMATGTSWPEVVGGFLMAGALMIVLAFTRRVDQVMHLLPMPIVMAMVAGVFLGFGTDLVRAVDSDLAIAGPMVLAFVLVSAVPRLARWLPAVLVALVVGAVAVAVSDRPAVALSGRWLAEPVWTTPDFSAAVFVELVIPLVVTVLVVQNGQGMAVLRAVGHQPPMNQVTGACGVMSLVTAPFGGVSTCLAGPTNALVTASGERRRHYAAAVWCGVLAIGFGLLAPGMVRVITTMPEAYVAALAGLAMLKPLQGAFQTAFSGPHVTGALVTFLVTVADITVFNIGSAFWGLVVGLAVSVLLDHDSRKSRNREENP